MKRLLFGLAFAGGFAASLAATKQFVPTDAVRGETAAALSSLLGRPVRLDGDVDVSVFPTFTVTYRNARLTPAEGGARLAEAAEVAVRLELLPLVVGRVSIDHVDVVEPVIELDRTLAAEALLPTRALLAGLAPVRLTVDKGRVRLRDPADERVETIDNVVASVNWPRPGSSASLETTFRWRGEAVAIAWQGLGPRSLIEGKSGPATLTITAGPLRIGFDGKGVLADRMQFDGAVKVTSADPARVASWLGAPMPTGALGRDLLLEGRMRSLGLAATVSDGRLTLDGNKAEGVVSVRLDAPRPQLRGTLAFEALDLARHAEAFSRTDWRHLPVGRSVLTGLDLDLRLSAATAKVGALALDQMAASVLLKDGRFDAEIGDAGLFGGQARVALRGESRPEGLKVAGRLVAANLTASAFGALAGLGGLEDGRLGFSLEGEADGATLGRLADSFAGRFHGEGRQLTLRSAERSSRATGGYLPIALKAAPAPKATSFERAVVDADIASVTAFVRRVEAEGNALSAKLSGAASLANGSLSLSGEVSVGPRAAGPTTAAVQPVWIGGTIFEPIAVVSPVATQAAPKAAPAAKDGPSGPTKAGVAPR